MWKVKQYQCCTFNFNCDSPHILLYRDINLKFEYFQKILEMNICERVDEFPAFMTIRFCFYTFQELFIVNVLRDD